jgi:hypothetical protein
VVQTHCEEVKDPAAENNPRWWSSVFGPFPHEIPATADIEAGIEPPISIEDEGSERDDSPEGVAAKSAEIGSCNYETGSHTCTGGPRQLSRHRCIGVSVTSYFLNMPIN